ncbi:MBL fold metallo-hydrolase [Polyangium sp. y55x31]|uniref:MBL fold metallo-hydrolase n=1 Tax=Polyangium sp. y55x31 TaxID=3042688 RepID=UPI0024827650|nr:MBL fold metallo-hydrolase [Polyangium sp. y55x31]MDI1477587.1 MBL fold metallo-hydrolase [Polyangium sp. y55x31]
MKQGLWLALGLGAALAVVACGDDTNNTNNSTSSSSSGSGGSGGAGGSGGTGGDGGSSALEVQTHVSPDGFGVDSHLIVGPTEVVLVDGQFFTAEAQKVVDLVKGTNKKLKTVFLTHAHPDHYLGMEVIRAAFPDAEFVTTAAVLADYNAKKDGTLAFAQQNFPGQVPDKVVAFTALAGATITVDGHTLDVVEIGDAGESVEAAGLALNEQKAFFAGDLVYNKEHLWLAECNLDGWIKNLDAIAAKGFTTFYPGHGEKATASVIDEDKKYLNDAKPILEAATTADEAVTKLKEAYPTWGGEGLLSFGTSNYFMACKTP